MRIAIKGAMGYLGQQIVPLLRQRGASVLLVERPTDDNQELQDLPAVGSENLNGTGGDFDALVYLSAAKADTQPGELEADTDFALKTCLAARTVGIPAFYFIASAHALDDKNVNLAVQRLRAVEGIAVEIVYVPSISTGNHGALGGLTSAVRSLTLRLVQAFRPTVDARQVADRVMAGVNPASNPFGEEIVVNPQLANPAFRLLKRLMDIAMALLVILALWWLIIIVWALVRMQSAGPGIFAQARIGKDQRVFTCYKFRTMYVATPDMGTHEVSASAVTPLGHLLRRTKIDELPQVINVLRNDMSFVGPRPCLPSQSELIEQRQARGIFDISPGITGLAQVQRVDMSDPVHITKWDYRYVRMQSLPLDLKILLATALGKGSGDRIDSGTSGPTRASLTR